MHRNAAPAASRGCKSKRTLASQAARQSVSAAVRTCDISQAIRGKEEHQHTACMQDWPGVQLLSEVRGHATGNLRAERVR